MANSLAYEWALANQGGTETLYKNINDFLAGTQAGQTGAPTLEQTQAAMAQYGVSPEDIQAATGRSLESFYQPQFTSDVGPASPLSQVTSTPTQPIGALAAAAPAQEETISVTTPPSAGYAWATQDPQGVAAGGLQNYYSNINKWFSDPAHTQADTEAAMQQYGISEADIQAATGKTLSSFYPQKTQEDLAIEKRNEEINKMASQILSDTPEKYWSGYGFGDAAANAKALAGYLHNAGITDVTQLGQRNLQAEAPIVAQTLDGQPVQSYTDESGQKIYYTSDGYDGVRMLTTQEISNLKPVYGREYSDEFGGYLPLGQDELISRDGKYYYDTGAKEWFNTATGKPLTGDYGYQGEYLHTQADPNILARTFAGKGSTNFNVVYDQQGRPHFYTTWGGSSNTLAGILDNPVLQTFANAVAAYFGGPLGVAALQAAQGKDIKDVAKAAALTYVGGQVGEGVAGATTDTLGSAGSNIAGNIASSYVKTGDLKQSIISGGVGGGVDFVASNTPGFSDMPKPAQDAFKAAVRAELTGKDISDAIVQSAIKSGLDAAKTEINSQSGGITNRVYDDTIVQAGADAFMRAKTAGASDEDAYAAAEAVTSAFTTPVTGGDTSKPVITDITSDQGEFAGLDEAIQKNAMDDAVRADKLDQIKNLPNFNDAFAQARELLGPNQTFEWNGKQYSTATFAEKPELSGAAVPGAASTTAGGGRGSYAGYSSVEDAASKANIPTAKAAELLDYITTDQGAQYDAMGNLISGSVGAPDLNTTSGKIANGIGNALNTFFGVVANTPVAAVQAGGNLLSNAGGIVDLAAGRSTDIGNKLRSLGDQVDTFSASISDPKIKTQQQEIGKSVSDADGLWNKTKALASAAVDNPLGAANWVFTEAFEEVPGVGLALKSGSKLAAYGITLANDMMESGGSAYNDTYKQAIKTMSEEDARIAARNASLASMVATGVTQGLVEGKLVGKMLGKETAGEFAEGSAQAAATQLALGQELNINNILTQGVIEAAIGKGASTTAEAVTTTNAVNNINTEVSSAVASGDPVAVSAAITNSIKTGISEGADPSAVISIATSTALANGADVDSTVNSVVTASINEEASNADAVADSVINAATLAGADVNAIAGALTDSLVASGVDSATASNVVLSALAQSSTKADAGTKTSTSVDANTGATTTTSTNANTNTQTTTQADANGNVTNQTTVNNNTGVTTNVAVDTKNNVSTQTVTDPNANTETTVQTNVNTNTQTTVVVNTQTGDIIDYVETTVPTDYKPPVIKTDGTTPTETTSTSTTPTTPSTTAATTPAPKTAPKGGGSADALMASIAASAPMGLSLTPQYLKSTVTGGAIDPLAAVKQAQQEMERDAIMQQIDPRLAQILMDRMGIKPQGGQMGAYGEASNEPSQNYYTYGQEDSIDDILGGKAANFKEGGYVAPLMATGGMALPLLAKSGGALSHYNGREDFKDGKHVAGEGDGQSDDIPAWLADGEFVFPADVVSALGNGSTKAGTDKLYEMMHNIRDRARSTGKKDLPPPALKSALDYLKSSKRS